MNSTGLVEFETQLKTVVTAKRLSGSKMAALTELAVENMHSDTQMISLMYRTHKGLPSASKISSLYVFDSVARAAYRTKSKKGLVADLNKPAGNAASFLVRLEGMLDGIVEDMLANGPPEAKEKTRKVLDIWTREGTFPASALKRLSERVSGGSSADSPIVTQGAGQLQPQSHTPPTPATPSSAIASLPPAILALLGSAVPAPPVTQPPPPQQFNLDPTQLALINQLTAQSQSATPPFSPARNGSTLPPQSSAVLTSLNTTANGSFSPTAPPYSPVRKDTDAPPAVGGAPSFERSRSGSPRARRGYTEGNPSDGREDSARFGDDRSSRFRDGHGGPRYEDRRGSRRFGDDRSPRTVDPRTRDPRRRSRSPRRSPGERRTFSPGNRRGSSPGRRPVSPGRARAPLPGAGESGKDEFGRDLRDGEGSPRVQSFQQTQTQSHQPTQVQSHQTQPTQSSTQGLESFDMASFNPAEASAWTALAAAWEITNGRAPTQEEMMVFVMGGGMPGGTGGNGNRMGAGGGDMPGGGWEQGGRGRGRGRGRGGFRGRGRGRGRGGFGGGGYGGDAYGGGAYGDAYGGGAYGGGSDAIVLGGGEDSGQGYGNQEYGNAQGYEQDYNGYNEPNPAPTPAASSGGGMKKIDGKWVWTKN